MSNKDEEVKKYIVTL